MHIVSATHSWLDPMSLHAPSTHAACSRTEMLACAELLLHRSTPLHHNRDVAAPCKARASPALAGRARPAVPYGVPEEPLAGQHDVLPQLLTLLAAVHAADARQAAPLRAKCLQGCTAGHCRWVQHGCYGGGRQGTAKCLGTLSCGTNMGWDGRSNPLQRSLYKTSMKVGCPQQNNRVHEQHHSIRITLQEDTQHWHGRTHQVALQCLGRRAAHASEVESHPPVGPITLCQAAAQAT